MNRLHLAALAAACSTAACDRALQNDLLDALFKDKGERGGTHEVREDATTTMFRKLGKASTWTLVEKVSMQGWQTFHTQGLVRIGAHFYVSAVEILEPRTSFGSTDALTDFSIDRTPGKGRGWLFKFTPAGQLVDKVELTDGDIHHPGGIDFDGKHLWVPVAEYRPNSNSHVYRVDPTTMAAEKVFSVKDHVGGVVRNRKTGAFHGVSWGSRRLYSWELHEKGGRAVAEGSWVQNPEHYIDYQDCHYTGVEYMLCGGLNTFETPRGPVAFGGMDLVDLRRNRPDHQIPVKDWVDEGMGKSPTLSAAGNAQWAEPVGTEKMRVYFMAENDNQAELMVYDVLPWKKPTP